MGGVSSSGVQSGAWATWSCSPPGLPADVSTPGGSSPLDTSSGPRCAADDDRAIRPPLFVTGASCSRHDPSSGQTSPATSPRHVTPRMCFDGRTSPSGYQRHPEAESHRQRLAPPSRSSRSVGLRPRTVYGMLHTVRLSVTMAVVMLTLAGVGEDGSSQAKGNAGGSTWERHFERQRLGARGSVVGSPARPRHLLARPGAAGRSSIRSRTPGVERLPVRQLGTPAGTRQGSLTLVDPTSADGPVPALQPQQRHPRWGLTTSRLCGVPGNADRVRVRFRPLSREGDVQGDVGRSWWTRMRTPDAVATRARPAAGSRS